MKQDAIWDHFQNEGKAAFDQAGPRLAFIVRQLRRGERTLNVGVGSGTLERLALQKGVEIWSLDPSERAISRVREELGLGERAQTGYSQDMAFAANSFDVVIMSEVLEHLSDKVREDSLSEIYRILRPGGRFIGTVPAREQLALSRVVCPNCEHQFHRWGHQASFDVASIAALLGLTFTPETVNERFFVEWDGVGWRRRFAGLIKKFLSWRGIGTYGAARNIFFIARKPD